MSEKNMSKPAVQPNSQIVEISDAHHAVFCPNPQMPIWSNHPRVFLQFNDDRQARCPYCSTTYRLKDGIDIPQH